MFQLTSTLQLSQILCYMDAHFNCGFNEERIVIHYPLNVLLQVRLPNVVACIVQA